ncbi:Hemolysin [Mycetohabitans rhizoxinica HKI 454]|uniref:Hemolysin n=1 Tax=Mycetohabitans rhizoxinica (strain DSM 19002 / CIP 109453 / HKI 454) TaxID=882378 RepID=E5AMV4_MYCRK|nr:Hemolysin [Mycetohabitans rhizoxinica HKI 454]
MYAKRYGLSTEQALEKLTLQANLQVQNGSSGGWNLRAHEFLT